MLNQLLGQILAILLPVFLIVITGYIYDRYHPADMQVANRINMDVFTPALLFSVLSDPSMVLDNAHWMAIATLLLVLGSGVIAWGASVFWRVQYKTLVPPSMFANTGNMGLPLTLLTFGADALPIAVMMFITTNLLHFSLGVSLLNQHHRWWQVLTMPMILATLAGLLVNIAQIPIPTWLAEPIKMLGQISIPLMLFALGVRLTDINWQDWRIGLAGGLLRPIAGAMIFILVLQWLPLSSLQRDVVLLYSVLPPAVLNYMLAEKYQQEPHKVASIVLIGNVLSLISMPLALGLVLWHH